MQKDRLNQAGFLFFTASLVLVFGFAAFNSWQQFALWQSGERTKFLLPPYQSFDYFVYYARYHFFNPYLVSLLMGGALFYGAQKLNRKYGERFFEAVEPYLLLISLFLSGTPGWMAYLIIFLSIYLVLNLLLTFFHFVIPHLPAAGKLEEFIRRPAENSDSSSHSELREESDSEILHSAQDDSVNAPIIQGKKELPRIPLFYLWIPSAISTIIISRWLATLPMWQIMKF